MATINKYHCKSFSYSAMVSGGKDIRKSGHSTTMVCLNCNNLYDALKTIMVENFEETYSNCEHCRSKKTSFGTRIKSLALSVIIRWKSMKMTLVFYWIECSKLKRQLIF